MKQFLKQLMVVCFMMMASANMVMAQRPNMEQFAKMQAECIAQKLAFDDKTSQKFIETYCACRKEMAATRAKRPHKKRSEMTDAEVDKAIKADFQQGRKLLDIREKYYKTYSKFLTPRQIQQVYDLERQDMKHFAKRGPRKDKK